MEKIVVCSTSPAKVAAVERVIKALGIDEYEVVPLETRSNVPDTPMSDEEGVQGCLNRIADAKTQVPDGDYFAGLEGIIQANKFGAFLCGWAVVEHAGQTGIGCSGKVRLPEEIMDGLDETMQLREKVAQMYPERAAEMPEIGTNGVLTNGRYTRIDEFEDALTIAFASLQNE